MPSGIVFRRVTVDDLADMVAIETASFPSPWSPSALLGELNADGSDARIACNDDGKTVGYLMVRRLVDEIHVMRIAVHQNHRRQGLAASLMQDCISEARRTRARAIVLEVRPSNTAAPPALPSGPAVYARVSARPWRSPTASAVLPASGQWAMSAGFVFIRVFGRPKC